MDWNWDNFWYQVPHHLAYILLSTTRDSREKKFRTGHKRFLKKFFLELGNIGLIQNGFLIFIRISTIPRIATGWDMQIYSRVRLQMVKLFYMKS